MNRFLNIVLCKALCLAVLACATLALPGGAVAAEVALVLVLPFQVNAGPEMPNASQDVPQAIADQLKQNGMRTVPMETARVLQRRKRTVTLMAHTVYDAAALRAGGVGIGQINA